MLGVEVTWGGFSGIAGWHGLRCSTSELRGKKGVQVNHRGGDIRKSVHEGMCFPCVPH